MNNQRYNYIFYEKPLYLFTAFLTVSPSTIASQANIYRSIDADVDARLIILPIEQSNQLLVSFDGFSHEFDHHATLYEKHMAMIPYIEIHLAERAPVKKVFTEHRNTAMQQGVQQHYQQKQAICFCAITVYCPL